MNMVEKCAVVKITVLGTPRPQGSKRAFKPPHSRFPTLVESSGDNLKKWRAIASQMAAAEMDGRPPITEPVTVEIGFYLQRPKSHFGTGRNAESLKDSAPEFPAKKPDIDKLCRAILDSLAEVVYRDDSQVVSLIAHKHWTSDRPRAEIVVENRGD